MTNTTQCPNCSSIFVITDEQYSASNGNVRCGSCREKFRVVFLANVDNLQIHANPTGQNQNSESTPLQNSELLRVLSKRSSQADLNPIHDAPRSDLRDHEFDENFHSELSISFTDIDSLSEPLWSDNDSFSNDVVVAETNNEETTQESAHTLILDDEDLLSDDLINEVDNLINRKLMNEERSHSKYSDTTDTSFSLRPSWQSSAKQILKALPLVIICLILLSLFTYQLWLKQLLPPYLAQTVASIHKSALPLVNRFSQQYGYTLPVRRDLNNLQLVSAQTEAHPTRASTILLRVSLLNRAKIEQSLPWLELSLTDENARLVSRRSFAPDDYIYNNATDNLISPNELKKITIELLAFPKQAHGYELKILNK